MTLVLRKIRKPRWYIEDMPWLANGECQADALDDLRTTNNSLSVWYILDDRSNLQEIVAALTATSDSPSNFDYALFGEQDISALNIKVSRVLGSTPDGLANSWHRDLVELSASKLLGLAKVILQAEKNRISEKDVLKFVEGAISSGRIQQDKLKEGLRKKIKK